MALDRALSHRRWTTSSLLWAAAPMLLSFAALPSAAQDQAWIRQLGATFSHDIARSCAPDAAGGAYVAGWTESNLGGQNIGQQDAWLAHYDHSGNRLWARQLGTTQFDTAFAASPDGSGGVYVSGVTLGSLGGPQAGGADAWLVRYDRAGNQLWIGQLGTNTDDLVSFASPDGSGGVYAGGFTSGSLGGTSLGFWDLWLARYDGAGNQLWIRQFVTSSDDLAHAAAPDASGGVYLTGGTQGSLAAPSAGGNDAWLARYDGAGSQVWIRQLGTSADDGAGAAAADGAGGVYVAGGTDGGLGGSHAGSADVWLARYDGAGNPLWIRQLGTSAYEDAVAAAVDASGGVYVSGSTLGSLGGPNAGDHDAWLAHYDGAGAQLWIHQLGTSSEDRPYAAAADGAGGVYMGGGTRGSLGGLNVAGLWDAWIARYDGPCAGSKYCTAKLNSAGCVPEIAASGLASASAGSGFTISTSNVLDNTLGLYFYSKTGPSSVPFQGGLLCAQVPLVRTILLNSGGNPPCGGSFQIDFNAYVASGMDPALVAGQQVWLQTWSRDPGFAPPNDTSLSDAVSFTLCP